MPQSVPSAHIPFLSIQATVIVQSLSSLPYYKRSKKPHGVAIFVETLTDNTTHTVGDVRSVFNKFNGNLGTQGI